MSIEIRKERIINRHNDILNLCVEFTSQRQIAETLNLEKSLVNDHVKNLLRLKLIESDGAPRTHGQKFRRIATEFTERHYLEIYEPSALYKIKGGRSITSNDYHHTPKPKRHTQVHIGSSFSMY